MYGLVALFCWSRASLLSILSQPYRPGSTNLSIWCVGLLVHSPFLLSHCFCKLLCITRNELVISVFSSLQMDSSVPQFSSVQSSVVSDSLRPHESQHASTYSAKDWCEELTHWKRPWCWERLKAGGEGDDRGWDGWMASPTRWTWVWASSGSWWWTGKPGVLQFKQ